jgi:hypothetical protein
MVPVGFSWALAYSRIGSVDRFRPSPDHFTSGPVAELQLVADCNNLLCAFGVYLSSVARRRANDFPQAQSGLNVFYQAGQYRQTPPPWPRELCRNLGDGQGIDQAAAYFWLTSMPWVNLTPVITFGN